MIKNIVWAFLEKGGWVLIEFISVLILSRLLPPQDFGVYSVMAIFICLSEILVDSGFGGAIVQKKEISQSDINTLFTSNMLISIFLYLILFCISPLVADFYNIPELKWYLRVLGFTVIIYSFTIVHITLLQRELKFRKSANIVLSASIVSLLVTISAAYMGLGIWTLIIKQLCTASFLAIFLWAYNNRTIKIGFSLQSFKALWDFGSKLLFANLLQTAYNNVSTSIIPKIASVRASGLYFQASRVNSIPVSILMLTIDKAVFPVLSKESTYDSLLNASRKLNRMINMLTFPLFPLIAIFSAEIIFIVLGEQWLSASIYLEILAWGGWGLMLQAMSRNIFKSSGRTSVILLVDVLKVTCGLLIILSAIPFGATFLVVGISLSAYVGYFIYMYKLKHFFGYRYTEQIADLYKPLLSAIISFVSVKILYLTFAGDDLNMLCLPLAIFYAVIYLASCYLLKVKELHVLMDLIKRKKK